MVEDVTQELVVNLKGTSPTLANVRNYTFINRHTLDPIIVVAHRTTMGKSTFVANP